jgi:hypothetical protein
VLNLKGDSLKTRLLALPTNIRLGWEGLPGTNTLAYYENFQVGAVKSFVALGLGAATSLVRSKGPTCHRNGLKKFLKTLKLEKKIVWISPTSLKLVSISHKTYFSLRS